MNYAFTDTITADAGYRYLKVDYDDGDYLLDVAFHGPFLGVVFEFSWYLRGYVDFMQDLLLNPRLSEALFDAMLNISPH